jgi:hypothetical protein
LQDAEGELEERGLQSIRFPPGMGLWGNSCPGQQNVGAIRKGPYLLAFILYGIAFHFRVARKERLFLFSAVAEG